MSSQRAKQLLDTYIYWIRHFVKHFYFLFQVTNFFRNIFFLYEHSTIAMQSQLFSISLVLSFLRLVKLAVSVRQIVRVFFHSFEVFLILLSIFLIFNSQGGL